MYIVLRYHYNQLIAVTNVHYDYTVIPLQSINFCDWWTLWCCFQCEQEDRGLSECYDYAKQLAPLKSITGEFPSQGTLDKETQGARLFTKVSLQIPKWMLQHG